MSTVVGIVQARMGSTRLPGKALMEVSGRPLLAIMLERVRRARTLDDVWVATTDLQRDDEIARVAASCSARTFRGSEDDVLRRYALAARAAAADVVVRLTADCPLIDPAVIDAVVEQLDGYELSTNAPPIGRTYPDGMDVEAMTRAALDRADRHATGVEDREHVTRLFHAGDFSVHTVHLDRDLGSIRVTVDTPDDLLVVTRLLGILPQDFTLGDVVEALGV